jgi:hypothetical protein
VEEEKRRPRETRSAPAATAGRIAWHRRPQLAALTRPPRRPALNEPPPSPVRRCPGRPSRPGSLFFSGAGVPPPPPTLILFLASSAAAAASASCTAFGLVSRHRCGVCRGKPWRHRGRSFIGLCVKRWPVSLDGREETRRRDKVGGEKLLAKITREREET